MRHVRITTPSRLHFSLLDLNGALGRIDGGFGLAIADPHFQIVAERAPVIDVTASVYRARAYAVLERLQKIHPFPGIKLTLETEIPNALRLRVWHSTRARCCSSRECAV